MAWEFSDFDEARDQARKSLSLPLGLASPLWLAFGTATAAGVAWWWMTRWTRAVNLEAMSGAAKAQVAAVEALVEKESEVATEVIEAAASVFEAATTTPPGDSPASSDDLTALIGIGPKLAAALAERGITTYAQLAAWSADEAEAFDAELSLKGRVARDAWVAQARRLAAD
ncbi:MAG TPA: hypothetical protein VGH15_12615 [Caulobacteraceae bacterium]|jgi:predicted flap endonuclease-1-like 5' DNA nuclease